MLSPFAASLRHGGRRTQYRSGCQYDAGNRPVERSAAAVLTHDRHSAPFAQCVQCGDDRGYWRPHLVALFVELGFDDPFVVENENDRPRYAVSATAQLV